MIHRLFIKNFGLIDQLDQTFAKGLNIITGETGTGKSMIVGALGLVFGHRFDNRLLKDPDQKCIIEATFSTEKSLKKLLKQIDVDEQPELIVRREFVLGGRSRSFINDTPVKVDWLKKVGFEMLDIHSQEQTFQITNPLYQLKMLDLFSANHQIGQRYEKQYALFEQLKIDLNRLQTRINKSSDELDFMKFQWYELDEASLKIDEKEHLEEELVLLSNADQIKQSLESGIYHLEEGDTNVIDVLQGILNRLAEIGSVTPWLQTYSDRFEQSVIELKDLKFDMQRRSEDLVVDEKRLNEVQERLDVVQRLEQKYRVKSIKELIDKRDQLKQHLDSIESQDDELDALKKMVYEAREKLLKIGQDWHKSRLNAIPAFTERIEKELKKVGIAHPSVRFEYRPVEHIEAHGLFDFEMLLSTNPDVEPGQIDQVASGGEKSRLMLVLKSILGKKLEIKTIVFDEIDSGISGDVAQKTGRLIQQLANDTQVLSITHLAQVACMGSHHLKVEKSLSNGKTMINVRKLNPAERIEELAEMISGKKITSAARQIATELLDTADESRS